MSEFFLLMKSELWITVIIFLLLIIKLGKGMNNQVLLTMVQFLLLINVVIALLYNKDGSLFNGMFLSGQLIGFQKAILGLGVYIISLSLSGWFNRCVHPAEFLMLMLSSLLGMNFLISSGNMLMLFLALELATIPVAVLANFEPDKKRSSEAAMKMILSSAFSSGIFLFGISLVYGATGTLDFKELATAITFNNLQIVAFVFVFSAFAFKLSVVPFHLWTADVYEGAPIPVTSFLSVISKGSVAFILLTVLYKVLPPLSDLWYQTVVWLSVLTMIIGNLFAIRQTNIKRFLAFSSIAQVGFILVGMSSGAAAGSASVTFFILVYLFSNLAAFVVAGILAEQTGKENIFDYHGLYKSDPFMAWMMALALFSLAGIPPTAGFFGKLFLLASGASKGNIWFITIAALNMVVSLYYYLRIIRLMFMEEPDAPRQPMQINQPLRFSLIICAVGIVFTGIFSWVYEYIHQLG